MKNLRITGVDPTELAEVLAHGVDHGGNEIEPFVDDVGGWPLRCCLTDTRPGDRVALIAWSPFSWKGVYAETGPVFVHAEPCAGPATHGELPVELEERAMVLRPYGYDHKIAYHRVIHVAAGESLTAQLESLLDELDVDFVHGRNVRGGCFSFEARSLSAESPNTEPITMT